MGVWSQPLFCTFPKGKLDLNKIDPNHPIFRFIDKEDDPVITLEYLMEMFSEHSKIWGHMTRDTMRAFEGLFEQILLQNPDCPKEIQLHFYCIDESMPYCLGYNVETKKAYYIIYHPYHGAFFHYRARPKDGSQEHMEFDEELYKKRYKTVFWCQRVYFEDAMKERGSLF